MKLKIKSLFYIRFSPSIDLLIALLTLGLVTWTYYLGTHVENPTLHIILTKFILSIVLTVVFPVVYLVGYKKQPLASVGIKKHLWWVALVISMLFSYFSFQFLIGDEQALSLPLFFSILLKGLNFWEPFFVYGWLQLRFENAFGPILAIIVAGICFGVYHIGTLPVENILQLIGVGVIYGFLFRLAGNNLIALFPMTWATGAWTGINANHFSASYFDNVERVLITIILFAWIAFMESIRHKRL